MNGKETEALIKLSEKIGTVTGTVNTFMEQQNIVRKEEAERDSVLFEKIDKLAGCIQTHEGKIIAVENDVEHLQEAQQKMGLGPFLKSLWRIFKP